MGKTRESLGRSFMSSKRRRLLSSDSILLVAAVNFLGLGLDPPAADWSLMISENRAGITVNPWAVIAPAIMIGLLTVCVNVIADAVARDRGTSVGVETMRR